MSSAKSLAEEGEVAQIQAVVDCGSGRFLTFTSCIGDCWIVHVTDGIDVWRSIMDKTSLDSHRELAEVASYEAYFTRFKKAFTVGDLQITKQAHKVSLDVGTGSIALRYDLYEATASERKSDLKSVLFWLAETVIGVTNKLTKCEEELNLVKGQKGASLVATALPDIDSKKRSGQVRVQKQQGHSIVNPSSKKRKAAKGVQFD
ncbi:protein PAXX-like [Acanthaster planci]|uniref:Protein PAXX-like n=1 Tax=Acanthaster planci TaxID=133434 RepID=A0A8B7Y3Q8_ACAPL|nr:protein PAXX-like [Acanthaster planci]XP_022087824.1 protein PAXX-like [Acanthaster planci]